MWPALDDHDLTMSSHCGSLHKKQINYSDTVKKDGKRSYWHDILNLESAQYRERRDVQLDMYRLNICVDYLCVPFECLLCVFH